MIFYIIFHFTIHLFPLSEMYNPVCKVITGIHSFDSSSKIQIVTFNIYNPALSQRFKEELWNDKSEISWRAMRFSLAETATVRDGDGALQKKPQHKSFLWGEWSKPKVRGQSTLSAKLLQSSCGKAISLHSFRFSFSALCSPLSGSGCLRQLHWHTVGVSPH